jgi:hypoxanthine phosphoribosyltransferase
LTVALAEIRFTAEQIAQRVSELGRQINDDLGGNRPLLVAVLKASVIFLADLARRLAPDAEVDFMSVSEYWGGVKGAGVVRIIKDVEVPIENRHVILVESIVDTGLSLAFLLRMLQSRNPASLKVCTLLDKPTRRIAQPHIDYTGFEIQEYVVGYGLDFKGKYRNLPFIVGIKDVPALAAKPDSLNGFLAPQATGIGTSAPMLGWHPSEVGEH